MEKPFGWITDGVCDCFAFTGTEWNASEEPAGKPALAMPDHGRKFITISHLRNGPQKIWVLQMTASS